MAAEALGTRIQLKEITSHDYVSADNTTVAITNFKVAGVYINYVYNQRTLGAEATGAIQVNNGSDEANYIGSGSTLIPLFSLRISSGRLEQSAPKPSSARIFNI